VNILFFKWLFHQVPIIVATGYFINIQFEERSIYFLPRVGNFHLFLNASISTCFILVIIYYAIGLTVTVLLICLFSGSFMNLDILDVLKFSNEYPPNVLFIHQFFLMVLSTFLIIVLNTLFTVLTKHSIVAFIITMIMIFVSVVIGYFIPELNKWLPYTQGMLAKHDTHNFTFEWSYIYVLSALMITLFLLNLLGQKYLETSLTEDLV
jgi:general stress protein CsbA